MDSFNLPLYFMSPQEFEAGVERNGCFSIVKMEILPPVHGYNKANGSLDLQLAGMMRAATEGLIKQHFGDDILDELFDVYRKKMTEIFIPAMAKSVEHGHLFVALKRKS